MQHARHRGLRVIDRCNLTILSEPGQEELAAFLAEHEVSVVASLPCYLEDNVDAQRGDGVFQRSIDGLRQLNSLGYGHGRLRLDLVYNPVGAHLPPPQASLQADYKRHLGETYGVVFDRLLTITNMPIARFAGDLRRKGDLDRYVRMLEQAHNPAAVGAVMCRSQLSVGWDGRLYDCDFNQMLNLELGEGGRHIRDLQCDDVVGIPISLGDHCYGCTAGAGSSCGGALA